MWHTGWDKIFENSRFGRYPPEELLRFLARNFYQVIDRKSIRILEVGCGPGANIWAVAREGFSTYAMDGSHVAIERARDRCREEAVEVSFEIADAMNLPYPNEFFDGVFELECIYSNNFNDSKKIISEIYRVLKGNGLFFSKTFSTGSDGDGKNTYIDPNFSHIDIKDQVLLNDGGVVRYTSELDIAELHSIFTDIQYEYLVRSDSNRKKEFREWLITCRK